MLGEAKMTLVEHLEALRRMLLYSLVALGVTTSLAYAFFQEQLMQLVKAPLAPLGLQLVFFNLTEAFFTRLKLSFLAGLILSLPFLVWQIWSFVVPALYPQERRAVFFLVPASTALFVLGVVFAYTTVFRLAVRYLVYTAGVGFTPLLSLSNYVSFLLSFLLPFGLIFQMPLVAFFLTRLGLVTPSFLARNRRYALLVLFVAAAVLTPGPDVFSQLALAAPMVLLYEASILISRLVYKKSAVGLVTHG